MTKLPLVVIATLLAVPSVLADTFLEDFESYNLGGFDPETTPDQSWYDYTEGDSVGVVTDEGRPLNGAQWFWMQGANTTDASNRRSYFTLEIPATLTETTFYLNATPYSTNGGSQQFVSIESSFPVRVMVQFYLMCNDASYPLGCDFKVRWEQADSTGQVLIPSSQNLTTFKIRVVPNWLNGTHTLYVNDVNDGIFPFLEIPEDIGRIRFGQLRADIPFNVTFDDWQVVGAINGTSTTLDGDIANGIKNFATSIRFTTSGSKFLFGFLVFMVLCAAVLVPLLALGLDNTVVPAVSFFAVLAALWMIFMEFWPDWIGIALIILVAALVGTVTRRLILGIRDASQGPGLVAGSLGYFIIATSLLAFSGYATETITIPTSPAEQQGVNETTNPEQTFIGAVAECIFTGGVFTFGLRGDCGQDTVSTTWKQITDVFGWVRAGFNFLFQLLTFQLPIPVIFNVMLVLPPAAALATYAIQVIRGFSA